MFCKRSSPHLHSFLLLSVASLAGACISPAPETSSQPIAIESSIEGLGARFAWARDTALSYAHSGADSVGLWYEAALPGRDAFCMRDVSHQALGAHFLGLDEHTRNMLFQFARHISEEKDWCSYWEIHKDGGPATVDYRDDSAFWYNLPANFDVMDASYRMYQWTGDQTYIEHPVFLAFYEKSVTDFVDRWGLGKDELLSRSRLVNRDSFDLNDPYQTARGIPTYHESGVDGVRFGIDLLSFQVAAYRAYAQILEATGQPAKSTEYLSRAVSTANLLTEVFFKPELQQFHDLYTENDETLVAGNMQLFALYNDAVPNLDHAELLVNNLVSQKRENIEMGSYFPEVLYRYGKYGEALDMIMMLTADSTSRRTYPEVSYAVVGAIATGLMGIAPLDKGISTISRLDSDEDFVALTHFSHRKTIASLRHEGKKKSILDVHSGEKLLWKAVFEGNHPILEVKGRKIRATPGVDGRGKPVSSIEIEVYPLEGVSVAIPEAE